MRNGTVWLEKVMLFFFILFCNCSEPSRFSCKSVNHACMNEHFYMEIYLADTPHRRNAQHFGGGSEQLPRFKDKCRNAKIPEARTFGDSVSLT